MHDREILESIWFSDLDLSEYAKKNYAMPAHVANFTLARTDNPATQEFQVTWTPPGGQTSKITYEANALHSDVQGVFPIRDYWWNGQGVSYMDYTETLTYNQYDPQASNGVLAAPLLWAKSMPTPDYATRASTHQFDGSVTTTFGRFKDAQCNPL
ncbi:MAG: hypothetical protein QOG31_1313 [Thermoplasmata archaeon]|jgi:hypothetical protein|nr:hypothetical protein [Thermoplasmata archaeon]